jgi:diguanylate cyclase (GGDEF)-like protein/PAS domain S-box-containing protein
LTFVNDAYAAYYGLPPQQLIGSSILSRVHPEDRERIKAYLASLGPENPRGEVERRVITLDGQVRWHQWTDQAILDDQGNVTEFQSTGRDVTERKLAQEELHRRAEELAALHEISLDINARRDLPSLLHTIVEWAVPLLGGTGGGLYLCQPELQQVRCVVSYQTTEDYTGVILKYGEGAAGIVGQTGEPLIIEDYSAWANRVAIFGDNPEIKSVVNVPMIWQGQVTGVILVLHSTQVGRFTRRDVELLSLLANQAAIAVENATLYEDAQRRAREAETLRQATAAVVATLDQNTAIEHILLQLERVVPYDSASVQLLRDGYVEIVGGRGWTDNRSVIGLRFPVPGDNPNSVVIQERRPYILQDAPDAHAPFRGAPHDHIHSWLGAPLFVHDRLIGMLAVDKTEPGFYQESHMELVTAFADQVAIAIENARLYSDVQQRITELEALRATVTDITAELVDLPKLLRSILVRATNLLNAPSGDLALYNEAGQEIEVVVSHNLGKDYTGARLTLGEGAMGKVAATRQPLFAENYQKWDGRSPQYGDAPLHAILAAPMLIRNRLVGVIGVGDSDPTRCFTPADLHLLTLFTQQAAIAVENARLFEETRRLAITDPLTGLYNRRGLFELGQREIDRVHRFHRPLAAIMLDIDIFKRVNDIYSHAVGDQVLRALAKVCQENLREVDLLGRYGGEEFAILLPETDAQAAEQVAERLRQQIASTPVETPRGPISFTVSLGVTIALDGISELAVLLDRADTAMYAAKQAGRNRVEVR